MAAAALPDAVRPAVAAADATVDWALDNRMVTDEQWADFLGGQDLLWRHMPTTWMEGPFLGDGRLGTIVYREPDRNAVRFTVQHGESQDHRPEFTNCSGSRGYPSGISPWSRLAGSCRSAGG